jgi:hypothetical protein
MFRSLKHFAFASVVVIPAFVGLAAVSAGATTHQSRADVAQSLQNVNLVGSGHSVSFSQSSVSDFKVKPPCSATNYAFSLTNTTSESIAVKINGKNAFKLLSGGVSYQCPILGSTLYSLWVTRGQRLRVMTIPPSAPSTGRSGAS